jgi:hypothetical protein
MPITVSPADKNGQTNGTTTFTRTYASGTVVTLTAPASAPNGYVFSEWEKNDSHYASTQSVTVTITGNTTMTVDYDPATSDTTPPTTTASPAGGSYSGSVSVTLTRNESGTTYYCTGSSSCSPTTVYSSAINISASTTLRY